MKDVPIIIVHRGSQYYLKYCINQVRYTNPTAPIYLLGDESNNHYPGVQHLPVERYMTTARQFEAIYKHLSARPYDYELFCIQRWFVILEMMTDLSLTSCIHLDSDMLVYSNLTDILLPYQSRLLAGFYGSPHILYFGQRDTLADFCHRITESYTNPVLLQRLEAKYQQFLNGEAFHGFVGISDMDLLMEYLDDHRDEWQDLNIVHNDGVFESNISVSEGYRLDWVKNQKSFNWQNGIPYAYSLALQRWIRQHTLHCQGAAKNKMPMLATFPKAPLKGDYIQDLVKYSGAYRLKEIYRYLRYGKAY